jgi:hypothetical protein
MPVPDPWSRSERRALVGFVALGSLLRVLQLASNPAQWLDEAMLSWSIVERDVATLLSAPLMYGQSAPPGYLVLARLSVATFGTADWVLRLVPFLASLAALFACVPLARHAIFGAGRVVFVGLMALAAPLILYAGQAKQYSSDVAASLLLLALGHALLRGVNDTGAPQTAPFSWKLGVMAAVSGAASVWLSLPAVFTLIGVSAALLFAVFRKRTPGAGARLALRFAPLLLVWGSSALAVVLFNRRGVTPRMLEELYSYWDAAFMPREPLSAALLWPAKALARVFRGTESAGLYYPLRPLFMLAMATGIVTMARRAPRSALLLGVPVLLALLAGAARQYPFADRLVLFLIPNLLCFVAEGVGQARCWASRWQPRVGQLLPSVIYVLAAFPMLQTPPPYQMENVKPLLARLRAERRPGDTLYVYYGGLPAYRYYVKYGQASPDYLSGACHREDSRSYLRELDRLRGTRRLWVLIAHTSPRYRELEDLTSYLNAIGTKQTELIVEGRGPAASANAPLPAALFLYDLSSTPRSAAVSAETFALLGPTGGDSRGPCE